ncbi:hypothetical protein ACP70R_003122 [Stipagrostis hirtigluma subsp. patula]
MPTSTTVSRCTAETEQGKHVFEILDYSQHRGMGSGEFIRSGTFSVGGWDWSIRFCPDGLKSRPDYLLVVLELMSKDAVVRASCDLGLVNQSTGLSITVHRTVERTMLNTGHFINWSSFSMKRSKFEASYLQDNRFAITCTVTVVKGPQVTGTELLKKIEVPPSDITSHLGKLLETEEGADVTFSVGGETFMAHKIVLAMRSPVLKAALCGPMREGRTQRVTIEDMQPAVFKALLNFIYTDSLPGMDVDWGDADSEMICHLLVAADRYAVDRLKLICQSILCKNLNVNNVTTTLALAYQHSCDRLKDVCLEFMTSSNNVRDAVVTTSGYRNLKRTCPSALVDAFEKTSKLRVA